MTSLEGFVRAYKPSRPLPLDGSMTFLLRLALSTLLGSLIGLERQWHQRFVGLRTNALVATGAAAFAEVALSAAAANNPAPILSTIITGIGFLGAGVIFKEGLNVRGINTAATIWCSAAVGTLAGIGSLTDAVIVAGAVVVINTAFRNIAFNFSRDLNNSSNELEASYQLTWICSKRAETTLRALLLEQATALQLAVHELRSDDLKRGQLRLTAQLSMIGRNDQVIEQAVNRLGLEPSVRSLHWQWVRTASHFE
jgi:putative Mg2+ transporter-C (MgtC) family protein